MSSVSKSYDDIVEHYKKEFPRGTPFVVACEKGRLDDVRAMIRAAGTDVTAMVNEVGKDSNGSSGYTPLMAAAWYEHSTIIEILLRYNADTATTTNYGNNALHLAARNNKTTTTTVRLLLNNMILEDINQKNTSGNTPLDHCYDYNGSSIKQQLIDLIRQKGGKRSSELSGGSSGSMARNNVWQDIWVVSSEEERSSDSEDEDGDNNNNNNPKIKKPKKKSKKRKVDKIDWNNVPHLKF